MNYNWVTFYKFSISILYIIHHHLSRPGICTSQRLYIARTRHACQQFLVYSFHYNYSNQFIFSTHTEIIASIPQYSSIISLVDNIVDVLV